MATHSRILAWKIPWTEEPGRLQSMESWRVGHDLMTSLSQKVTVHILTSYLMFYPINLIKVPNLTEFVMDREAWRAVIHGVTMSRAQLSYWTELTLINVISPGSSSLPIPTIISILIFPTPVCLKSYPLVILTCVLFL